MNIKLFEKSESELVIALFIIFELFCQKSYIKRSREEYKGFNWFFQEYPVIKTNKQRGFLSQRKPHDSVGCRFHFKSFGNIFECVKVIKR